MSETTSYYEAIGALGRADLMSDAGSELARMAFMERAEGSQIHRLVFGEAVPVPSMLVETSINRPVGDKDAPQVTAEFAEIPIIDPVSEEPVVKKLDKHTVGVRVSWEQHSEHSGRAVQREIDHLLESVNRWNVSRMLSAIDAQTADSVPAENRVDVITAETPWLDPASEPLHHLAQAQQLIMSATYKDVPYAYRPSVLLAHPLTATNLSLHPSLQAYYQGSMAGHNPFFSGVMDNPRIGQLQVAADFNIPMGDVYVLQGAEIRPVGTEWTYEQADGNLGELPGFLTDWYEEGGASGRGGFTMSYRSDFSNFGTHSITDPKAIVKITGVV